MANHKKWAGYLLFATVVAGLFMYFCFPSQAVSNYLEGSATRFAPALAVRVEGIRPALPFGLQLENTSLSLKERPHIPLFTAHTFEIMPSMGTLTLRRPAFRFDCGAYGGRIEGVIAFETFLLKGPVQSDIEIRSVRLDQYPRLKEWFYGDLGGLMNGTIAYACNPGDFINGTGQGDFSISEGTVRFVQPFLGMESVRLDRIEARMLLDNQMLSLDRCDFKGEQIRGKASGTIYLKNPIGGSRLDLTVTLEEFSLPGDSGGFFDVARLVGQGNKGGDFSIDIRGTVDEPRISFS